MSGEILDESAARLIGSSLAQLHARDVEARLRMYVAEIVGQPVTLEYDPQMCRFTARAAGISAVIDDEDLAQATTILSRALLIARRLRNAAAI